jgi:hypothetical protein
MTVRIYRASRLPHGRNDKRRRQRVPSSKRLLAVVRFMAQLGFHEGGSEIEKK